MGKSVMRRLADAVGATLRSAAAGAGLAAGPKPASPGVASSRRSKADRKAGRKAARAAKAARRAGR